MTTAEQKEESRRVAAQSPERDLSRLAPSHGKSAGRPTRRDYLQLFAVHNTGSLVRTRLCQREMSSTTALDACSSVHFGSAPNSPGIYESRRSMSALHDCAS